MGREAGVEILRRENRSLGSQDLDRRYGGIEEGFLAAPPDAPKGSAAEKIGWLRSE